MKILNHESVSDLAGTGTRMVVANATGDLSTQSIPTGMTYTGTAPINVTGTVISIPKATTSVDGYLAATDFTTFNNKVSSASAFTTGSIPFSNSSGQLAQNNSNIFWDNTNIRLGIGTNTPDITITMVENINGNQSGLRVRNNGIGNNSAARIYVTNNNNDSGQLFKISPGYSTYKTLNPNDLGFYSGSGNISILNDNSSGNVNITAGGQSSPHFVVSSTGNVGVGVTSPTANLHVKAGSTILPQFKLTAGTILTTPVADTIENSGTHLYWTASNGTRYQLDQQSGASPTVATAVTISGTLTSTTLETVPVNSSSATTQTLPTTPASGTIKTVKNINTGVVTIAGTIDGVTNYILYSQWDSVTVQYVNSTTNWIII